MKKKVSRVECFFDALLIVLVITTSSCIYAEYRSCKEIWTFDYGCAR